MYLSQREAYRARLRSSAPRAALPGSKADWITAVAEKVSQQVASHTKLFPLLYGNSAVHPDVGRRPYLAQLVPGRSRALRRRVPAAARHLGLSDERGGRRSSRRRARDGPAGRRGTGRAGRGCGSHTAAPRRRATATRTVSSSR